MGIKYRKVKVNNKHEISNKKLATADHYRVQTQSKDRRQKLTFAIFQTFMSDKHPKTWQKIRDESYSQVVSRLIKAFKIMMDRDPEIARELWEYTNKNICEDELLEEATKIINYELRK